MTIGVPSPTFHGRTVLIDYGPDVPNSTALHALISSLVAQVAGDELEEELLIGLMVAKLHEYRCQGHLTGRTDETIEFTVEREQEPADEPSDRRGAAFAARQ
jgi:hypothetical protein